MIEFRFLGIPVTIQPSFLIFFLLFTELYRAISIESLLLGAIMVFSLLVHEYGHGLAAQHFGAKPEINLEAFGGNTQYLGLTEKQSFFVTLSGPLLESILIAIPYFILKNIAIENYYAHYALLSMLKLNILWCLLNLIPLAPLDGGKMANYLLEKAFGETGLKIGTILGLFSAFLGGSYLLFQGYFFFGALLFIYGFQNVQIYRQLSPKKTPAMLYEEAVAKQKRKDLEAAKAIFKKLLHSKNKTIKSSSVESFAKILYEENKSKEAYKLLLQRDPSSLKSGKCLLCKLAYEAKNYALIEQFSQEIYEIEPSYEIALLNSKAFAHLKKPAYAGGWLKTASLFEGAPQEEISTLLNTDLYATIKDDEEFRKYGPNQLTTSTLQ